MSAPTALAAPRRADVERLQWLTPAPLWETSAIDTASSGLTQPWIAELRSDTFVRDFLDLVGGQGGASPASLADTAPHRTVGGVAGAPFRLFQPLSQCFYLVSATLACRRPGIPDHAVKRAKGERTSFVIRRIGANGGEQAWVPSGGTGSATAPAPGSPPTGTWVAAPVDALVAGEEKFPMHPAPVGAFAEPGSTAAILGMAAGDRSTRTVFYGYIPVGRRERMIPALPDPVAALAAYAAANNTPAENPALYELIGRVVQPWAALQKSAATHPGQPYSYPSLFLLLDLADWLSRYLPDVYHAITTGSSISGAQNDLLVLLQQTTVLDGGSPVTIATALAALEDYAPLVTGADIPGPSNNYDLTAVPVDSVNHVPRNKWYDAAKKTPPVSLADYALAALSQVAAAGDNALAVPPELQGLIKLDPVAPASGTAGAEPTYVIRAVFLHDPCQPVLSAASHAFVLARAVDGDAPARKIRIQLPDVTNMRQFQRGVALEVPPGLRKVLDAVTPDVLKGDPLSTNGVGLGMICSFSIQIIFMCAFIVLFIFLLLLNIVFWWMAFLKICFPIPVPTSKPKAPQP